jgi:hypothetical protein
LKNLEASDLIESRHHKILIVDAVGLSALVDATPENRAG